MKAVAQENNFGCSVACVAAILNTSYQQTLKLFAYGKRRTESTGFYCKDIIEVLQKSNRFYEYRYISRGVRKKIYYSGTIVFVARSKQYPSGHFLVRTEDKWMDPWINFQTNRDVFAAKAGFRKRLPGRPIYAILQKGQ